MPLALKRVEPEDVLTIIATRRLATQLLLGAALVSSACATSPASEPPRVIAIGDVHGAYDSLLHILEVTGLVDGNAHWVGGEAILVQLGDLIDRGTDDRKVLELMMRLEREAERAGGRVIALLGNHEVMNLHGDLSYVSPESMGGFADLNSQQRLESAYEEYLDLDPVGAQAAARLSWPNFVASHPVGLLEHREAFARQGPIGRWLRERRAIARIGDVVFLHGGLHPDLASRTLAEMNEQIEFELSVFDETRDYLVERRRILASATIDQIVAAARSELEADAVISALDRSRLELVGNYENWMLAHPNGPLWFRGLARWTDEELAERVPPMLEAFGVEYVVIGHTPQLGSGIVTRLDDRVFLIDTGMLDGNFYPGGVAQALEIVNGNFRIIDDRGTRAAVP